MQLNEKLISHLEQLARLELSEAERKTLLKDLNNILEMVSKMDELDTTGVAPLNHVSEVLNVLRKDEVAQQLARQVAMKNAPVEDGVYFKVPKVIDLEKGKSGKAKT